MSIGYWQFATPIYICFSSTFVLPILFVYLLIFSTFGTAVGWSFYFCISPCFIGFLNLFVCVCVSFGVCTIEPFVLYKLSQSTLLLLIFNWWCGIYSITKYSNIFDSLYMNVWQLLQYNVKSEIHRIPCKRYQKAEARIVDWNQARKTGGRFVLNDYCSTKSSGRGPSVSSGEALWPRWGRRLLSRC